MIKFPLLPLQNVPCIVKDVETGEEKEIQAGQGRAVLAYFASLSPGALKNGSVAKIEIAMGMKGAIHNGRTVDTDVLPQCAGKQVLAVVVNKAGDNGQTQANVNDLFKM